MEPLLDVDVLKQAFQHVLRAYWKCTTVLLDSSSVNSITATLLSGCLQTLR